ncbi:hypothetical protein Gotur_016480 [Gossypium turneri]
MHSLRQKASEWSGIDTADAFAIDDTNLFHKLGLQTFISLSPIFTPGFTMTEKPFRINMNSFWNEWEDLPFIPRGKLESPLSGLAKAESSIPCFCCDALAGDPALIGRHRPFPVTHQAAERWLHHMEKALESTPYIDADSKLKMMKFFRHTAFFLVAGDELKNQNQRVP